jgi:hypothetical protein
MLWLRWGLLVAANALLFVGGKALRRRHRLLPADQIFGITSILAIDLFVALREFFFDVSGCGDSPSLACVLNQNIGVLTLGVVIVTAAAVYVGARLKQTEDRRAETKRRGEASRKLCDAVEELVHNLQHFAGEVDDAGEFRSFPATTFEATLALLESGAAAYFHPRFAFRIGTMQRLLAHNRAALTSAAELDPSLKVFSLLDHSGITSFSTTSILRAVRSAGASQAPMVGLVRLDERIVVYSVRFVMEALYYHERDCGGLLHAPQFGWLKEFRVDMKRLGGYCYYHKASEIEESEAADLRSKGMKLYCWIKDGVIEGVEIVGLRISFHDLAHKAH